MPRKLRDAQCDNGFRCYTNDSLSLPSQIIAKRFRHVNRMVYLLLYKQYKARPLSYEHSKNCKVINNQV